MNEFPTPDNPVVHMTDEQAFEYLGAQKVGRLALTAAGVIDIYPVTYVVDNRSLVFITSPGTKLLELTVNDHVAFEIDGFDDEIAWSVVLHGTAERLEAMADIEAAEALPLIALIPTPKTRFVRIHPTAVSGRIFSRL